jgi:hypothetical protein
MAEFNAEVPMFVQLLVLNRQAFVAGHYNTAYHLLAAALEEAGDEPHYIATVEQLALRQLAEFDAAHPEYEHSTASAAARGGRQSIFRLLARRAQARQAEIRYRVSGQQLSTGS